MCSCVYACVQRPDIYRRVFLSHSSPHFFEKRPFIGLEFTCWLDWLSSKLYGPSWLCLPRPGLQVHATVLCFQCRCLGPNSGPPACIANALLTELSPSPSECIFHCCHHCVCTGNGAQSLADAKPERYHRPTLSSVHFFWFELHKIALKGSPPPSKSTYFQNHFPLLLFITAFCSVVLRNRTENHHVTLAKLTLQGSATSTCIIPREEKKRSVPGSRWEYHHETNKDMQICLSHSSFAWCFFGFAEPQY